MSSLSRFAMMAAGVGLLAAACTSTAGTAGDLVVVSDRGEVVVVGHDGGESVSLDDGGSAFQPIWSPDGERVTFSAGSQGDASVVTVSVSDGDRLSIPLATRPFFVMWDPPGTTVGWLRGTVDGIVFETAGDVQIEDDGRPFYLSWAPDGSRLAAHVGIDRLDDVGGDGATPLGVTPGTFQAPVWTDDGVVAVARSATGQHLVVIDGAEVRRVASVDGVVRFVVAANRAAVETFPAADQPDRGNGVAAAFETLPTVPQGRLVVVDLASGDTIEVLDRTAAAFFWSPDGRKLLILDVVDRQGTFRWLVWEDGDLASTVDFVADPGWFQTFVPFFDQYAQSMTLWSPDSTAFAFPGIVDDRPGVWVQDLSADEPRHVADGSWVAWRP